MSRLFLLLLPVLLLGCAQPRPLQEHLPVYRWTDDQAALRELASRAHSIKTISAAAFLTLTRPDGQSVRLDAAMAISLADKSVRLRAWKLSQVVFDLTLTPAGLWIETPTDSSHRDQIAPASLSAAQFARAISVFGGEAFEGPGVQVIDHGGPDFRVLKTLDDGKILAAEVERSTLVIRRYRLADRSGAAHFDLVLRDYQSLNGIAWPQEWSARSDSGTIEAQLRDVQLNTELPPSAFVPPRGAEKAS